MGKIKKEPIDADTSAAASVDNTILNATAQIKEEETYDDKLRYCNTIAHPMASKKLAKKAYKLIKHAAKQKSFLRSGLKDVQMRLRKGEKGIVVFAGDVTPIEIMCHLPAVCEEKGIPYAYTPSRSDLGAAMGMKRGSVMMLIREHPEYKELYDEVKTHFATLNAPL